MSYIPDVRQEFITENGEKVANPYFEGNLPEERVNEVNTYDYAVEQVNNFFCNLDIFEDIIGINIDIDNIDQNAVFDDDLDLYTLNEEELSKYSKDTIIIKSIRDSILVWLELERDSLVTSMIESNT